MKRRAVLAVTLFTLAGCGASTPTSEQQNVGEWTPNTGTDQRDPTDPTENGDEGELQCKASYGDLCKSDADCCEGKCVPVVVILRDIPVKGMRCGIDVNDYVKPAIP